MRFFFPCTPSSDTTAKWCQGPSVPKYWVPDCLPHAQGTLKWKWKWSRVRLCDPVGCSPSATKRRQMIRNSALGLKPLPVVLPAMGEAPPRLPVPGLPGSCWLSCLPKGQPLELNPTLVQSSQLASGGGTELRLGAQPFSLFTEGTFPDEKSFQRKPLGLLPVTSSWWQYCSRNSI